MTENIKFYLKDCKLYASCTCYSSEFYYYLCRHTWYYKSFIKSFNKRLNSVPLCYIFILFFKLTKKYYSHVLWFLQHQNKRNFK